MTHHHRKRAVSFPAVSFPCLCLLFETVSWAWPGCTRAAPEPPPPSRSTTPIATPRAIAHTETLDSLMQVLETHLSDGGVQPSIGSVTELFLSLPDGLHAVEFSLHGKRHTALIADQNRRVTFRLSAVETALAYWNHRGVHPDAQTLARVIAALVYPRFTVFDRGVSEMNLSAPRFIARNNQDRVLVFAFAIADGEPGAGVHLARFHLTPSGLVIDENPHPERR